MVRLAEYSRDCLKALRAETKFSMKGVRVGRCNCSVPNNSRKRDPRYRRAGRCWRTVSAAESSRLAEVEPALAEVAHKLTAACNCPMMKPETASCLPRICADGGAGGG